MLEPLINDANQWLKKHNLRLIWINNTGKKAASTDVEEGATTDPAQAQLSQQEQPVSRLEKLRANMRASVERMNQ